MQYINHPTAFSMAKGVLGSEHLRGSAAKKLPVK
jgi:hypothetical protein